MNKYQEAFTRIRKAARMKEGQQGLATNNRKKYDD